MPESERSVPVELEHTIIRSTASAASATWAAYGRDELNSQWAREETTLSKSNVGQLQEKWRVKFQSGATSQPAVYDGKLYFGGWDGRLYAADAQSGEILWKTLVTNMYLHSTPAVAEDRVYVAAGSSLIAVQRSDGSILFDRPLDSEPTTLLDGSPKLIDDLVIVGVASGENTAPKSDYTFIGSIVAVDANTGEIVWRLATTGEAPGPCVGGAGVGVWSSAAFDRDLGLLYIGTGENYEAPAGNCEDALLAIHYARNYSGDRVAWKVQYNTDDIFLTWFPFVGLDGDVGASPNLFEVAGKPLVGVGDKAGTYRVFDRRTGEQVWRRNLDVGENTGIGGVMTTAAVGGGRVFTTSNQTYLDGTNTSVLYSLDAATGTAHWKVELPSLSFGAMTLANGVLYHTITTGALYARDADSGAELWQANLENASGSGPTVANGRLYVSSGMAFKPDLSDVADALVFSFGLPENPPVQPRVILVEPVGPPPPATLAECKDDLGAIPDGPSPICSDCLCQCNPTAWANCPWCWNLSGCTMLLCGFAAPGPDLQQCLEDNCAAKLVPSGQFHQNLEAAPCVQQCALQCAL